MRACVVGATGYAGRELVELLHRHPTLEMACAMGSRPGAPAHAPGPTPIEPLAMERFGEFDGVFLCTPHGTAAPLARLALEAGARVVDLSADLRLGDPALYEATYGLPHPEPALCDGAVYGLTETAREALRGTRLVANPGCYPTAILLPLLPLLGEGLVDPTAPIVADAKSGVSGAGRAPSETTHYGNVHENLRAYALGTHRHTPEIHRVADTDRIVFVPHLLPCFRGLLATIYLTPAPGVDGRGVQGALERAYAGEPFVEVLEGPGGRTPALSDVVRTNRCAIGVAEVGPLVVLVSALDNLVKGAAGQALQNMNLALGLEEGAGLG